jgi:hypothetical protein
MKRREEKSRNVVRLEKEADRRAGNCALRKTM